MKNPYPRWCELASKDGLAALKRAGLRGSVRLHDLRNPAAAAWLATGLPIMYVQRQLGPSDIGTTIRNYGHLEESFLRDAAERAEVAIFGADPVPAEVVNLGASRHADCESVDTK